MKVALREERKEKLIFVAVLTALIIVMSLTPLGYLKMPRASITFLPVLVVIGAVQYGPLCGLYLGTVFGLSSFVHCFDPNYAFGQTFLHISTILLLLVVKRRIPQHCFLCCGIAYCILQQRLYTEPRLKPYSNCQNTDNV